MRNTRAARYILFALVAASSLALGAAAQTDPAKPKSKDSFQRASGVPLGAPKEFEFALGRFTYHIKPNGNGQRTKGGDTRRFALSFGSGEDIKYIYFADHNGDLLLTCEVSGEHGGTSYAVRIEQPSMRARWTTNIPATQTGEPTREGSRLYVTGKYFAGALDLQSGELLWYVDKFPGSKEEFNSFEAPEPRGREVLFRTRPVYNGRVRTVVVNAKTGKIVRAE